MRRLTAGELAKACGVVKLTVLRWEKNGKIPRAHRTKRNDHRFWSEAEAEAIIQWAKAEQEVA